MRDGAGRAARRARSQTGRADRLRSVPGAVSPGGGMSTVSRARNSDGAEDAADRLGEARRRCIASRGPRSGKPQSQAGARRIAREARRWIAQAVSEAASRDEQRRRAGRYRSCGSRRSARSTARRSSSLRRHRGRRPAPATTGASASITKPGRMPASRHSAASTSIAASEKAIGLARVCGGGRARPAEEGDAEGLARSKPRRARPTAPAPRRPPGQRA